MAAAYGIWALLEHPADKKREPYASIFSTFQVRYLQDAVDMKRARFDQCMFGCHAMKPTEVITNDVETELFEVRCIHVTHLPVAGLKDSTTFHTTSLFAISRAIV